MSSAGDGYLPDNIPNSRDAIIRLEVQPYPIEPRGDLRPIREIFCSKDHIHTDYGDRTDQFLALRHYQLGCVYNSVGRHVEAAVQFRAGSKLAPDDCKYLVELGRAMRDGGDLTGAQVEFTACLQLGDVPEDTRGYVNRDLGDICRRLGDHESSRVHYQVYLELMFDSDEHEIADECLVDEEIRAVVKYLKSL
ncbi:MAG: hypothetical protein ABJA67_14235 [Chthonomonadales bacterium]